MPSAYKRPSGRWQAVANVNNTRKYLDTFPTEEEARDVAAKHEEWLRIGSSGIDPVEKATITIEEYWTKYFQPNASIKLTTMSGYRTHMKKRVLPRFSDTRMRDLETTHVRGWLTQMERDGVSQSTRRGSRAALSAVMEMASIDGWLLGANPVHGIEMDKPERKEITVFDIEQFARMRDALPTAGARLATRLAVLTGVRYGETTEFRVKDLDLDRRGLHVRRHVVWLSKNEHPDGKSGPLVMPGTKAGAERTRTVPLSVGLRNDLAQWIKDNDLKDEDLLFPAHLVLPTGKKRSVLNDDRPELTDEFVKTLGQVQAKNGQWYFHGTMGGYYTALCRCDWCRQYCRGYTDERAAKKRAAAGKSPREINHRRPHDHVSPSQWSKMWNVAVTAANLPFAPTTHHLRHTCASWLIDENHGLLKVMNQLGHKDLKTTELYVHISDKLDTAAADLLSKYAV